MPDQDSVTPAAVLHEDDPDAAVVMPDGRVVRNLSAAEYAATWAGGTVHEIPSDVLAQAKADAARITAERKG